MKKTRGTTQYRRPGFQAERKVTINPTPTGIHKTVVGSKTPGARKDSLTDTRPTSKSPRSITPQSPHVDISVTNGFKSPSPAQIVSPVERQPPKVVSPPPREPTPEREPTPQREPTPEKEPTPTPPREPTPPRASPEADEDSLSLEERQDLLTRKVRLCKTSCGLWHICGQSIKLALINCAH